MQFEKAHLSQSNRTEACFFGQQGMPSAICMACPSAAGAMVAVRAEGAAAIGGAAGPITTPTAIPSAKNQRMAARSFMAAKSHRRDGLRSPMILNLEPVGGRSHHALVRGDGPHLKAALRPDSAIPAYRSMETRLGRAPASRTREQARQFVRWATLRSSGEQRMVFFRRALAQRDATGPRPSAN